MQVACFWISHLPVKVELHRSPQLKGRPIIIGYTEGARRIVLDASPQAKGVHPGMPLSAALSTCKEAVLLESNPIAYEKVFGRVLDALEDRCADVEVEGLGLAYARMNGLEMLYGSEARLVSALLHAAPEYLHPRIGVASGKFPAYLAALSAEPDSAHKAPEDARAFVAEHSVDVLPLSWQEKGHLHGFGLHTLGQIAELPVGPLQSQFGLAGKRIWELVNGMDRRPLLPRKRLEIIQESLTFSDPVSAIGAVVIAADTLMGRALSRPAMRGRYARLCTLEAAVFRSSTWKKRMVFRQPIGDHKQAVMLVKHTLEGHPPPGMLEGLTLTLAGLTGEAGKQESLFHDARRQENLKEALRQLEARIGRGPHLYVIREMEPWSHLPEERTALVPFVP